MLSHVLASFFLLINLIHNSIYNNTRPSKTDSTPVRGNGYKLKSSKFRLRANAETSHSVRYDIVVAVAKNFHIGW